MADEDFIVRLELDVRDARGSAEQLATTLARLNKELDSPALQRAERELAKFSGGQSKATTQTQSASQATATYNKYLYDQGRALGYVQTELEKYRRASAGAAQAANAAGSSRVSNNLSYIPENDTKNQPRVGSSFGTIVDQEDKAVQQASRSYNNLSTSIDGAIDSRRREQSSFAQSLQARLNEEEANKKLAASNADVSNSLANTRYAVYDVSRSVGILGLGMLGLATATASTAIAFERDFANVIRTAGPELQNSAEATKALRDQFIDLAQTIPLAFSDITAIGTLGGQLGIASDDLADFVRVVAQFSATTDVSVEEAATAFGRLDSLLPGVAGNYEALGSSILLVGTNSVATEGQIVKTATQIAAMGNQAGLTAAEVVGLAGAFASIGVQPELARGTVTRVFSLMGQAASEGGEKLEAFARISGVSADEFRRGYGKEGFGDIFLGFMKGIAAEGTNANAQLQALGINSVRDRPALLNLANAADSTGKAAGLLAQTLKDAGIGFSEQTELGRQYGIIAETTAAKLQILVNTFQTFLDALGSGIGGPLDYVIERLTDFLRILTDLAASPIGQWVGGLSVALLAIVGTLLVLGAGALAAFGGILAFQTALAAVPGAIAPTSIGLAGLNAQLLAAGGAGRVAAAGLGVATAAAKLLSAALVVFAAIEIGTAVSKGIGDLSYQIQGLATDFDSSMGRIEGDYKRVVGAFNLGEGIGGALNRAFAPISSNTFLRDIAAVDEGLAKIASDGGAGDVAKKIQEMSASFVKAGGDTAGFNAAFVDTVDALKAAGYEVEYTKAGVLNLIPPTEAAAGAVNEFATEEEVAIAASERLATSLGLTVEELDTLSENLTTGSSGFVNFSAAIKASTDEFGNFDINTYIAQVDEMIAKQQQWAADLALVGATGRTGFVTEIAKLGPEGAPVAAAAAQLVREGAASELDKLEEQARLAAFFASEAFAQGFEENNAVLLEVYKQGGVGALQAFIAAQIDGSPAAMASVISEFNLDASKLPIQFQTDVNTGTAERKITQFVKDQSGKTIVLETTTTGRPVNPGQFASGGLVRGPGTGTSDSIPARLSNNEYVIRAASVRKYGTGLFDSYNRGVAKFASGGLVGGGRTQRPAPGGGITVVELSAFDRSLLSRIPEGLQLNIDGRSVARAVNNANTSSAQRGSN